MLVLHGVGRASDHDKLKALIEAFQPLAATLAPGATLRILRAGPIALIATDAGSISESAFQSALGDIETAQKLALAHSQLLNRLITEIDVLPARLSGARANEKELLRHAAERRYQLLERLNHIAGAAEYALKISWPVADEPTSKQRPGPAASGRDYLMQRLDRRRSKAARQKAIDDLTQSALRAAESFGRDLIATHGPTERRPNQLLDLAILAPKSAEPNVAALAQLVAQRGAALGLQSEAVGPWAPFSFTERAEDLETAADAEIASHPAFERVRAS